MDPQPAPPQSSQPGPIYQQQSLFRIPLIIGTFVLLVFVGVGAYYLGSKQASKQLVTNIKPISTPALAKPTITSALTSTPIIQSTTPFYSSDLDATFYIPAGWTINVSNRDPSFPENTTIPCYPSDKEFYKNPSQCTDAANTFLIGINTSSKQSHWPNFDMNIVGPTSGLGGACPPEYYNYTTQSLNINNKPFTVKYAQDKTSGTYKDCFQFPIITESGAKSKWKEFNVMFVAPSKDILDSMLNILQTAKFN
jgi:hypothetical protein